MAKPWDISGDDLVAWSEQYDAVGLLPDLIRRLLLATSPLSSISMRAHGGVRFSGWDGVVNANAGTPFCPRGLSVWELTLENNQGKLAGDFQKRTADPLSVDPKATTYVALTARRFASKVRWVADQRSGGRWMDVRLLDADDVATWLSQAPGVALWFAERLNRPTGDLEDLAGFLDRWSRRTRPPLPTSIALAGQVRQEAGEEVREWARAIATQGQPLYLQGSTWEEAAVFAAAALAEDKTAEGEQLRARTVVARTDQALRWALRIEQKPPILAIAAFQGAFASTGAALVPLEGRSPGTARNLLHLELAPHLRFGELLVQAGMVPSEATRVARDSGGSLTALQRLLGYVELPQWAEGIAPASLSALLLAGAFEAGNPDDDKVLTLLGAEPGKTEPLCERLRLLPDAPTHREAGNSYLPVWTWRSPGDAWQALAGQIPADALRRFRETVRQALGQSAPTLGRKPGALGEELEPYDGLGISESLRQGLVQTLARLAQSDSALALLHGPMAGSRLAMASVRDLLPPNWESWAALAELLPLLAEAAPETFLDCVEASLRAGDGGVAHLLAEESLGGPTPHTGLLWALETLGWDDGLMPRVAAALGRLAEYDRNLERPGRISNRPEVSLKAMLRIALPQTLASPEHRQSEMARRLKETPEVGFRLLIQEIGRFAGGGFIRSSRQPTIWPLAIPTQQEQLERTNSEAPQVFENYRKLAFEHAGQDASRWSFLLEHAALRLDLQTAILDQFESIRPELRDEHALVWKAIRSILHRLRTRDDADEVYDRWKPLYDGLEPKEPVLRYAWLLRPQAELPGPRTAEIDLEADDLELSRLRRAALEDIGSLPERLELLGALLEREASPLALGVMLAEATWAGDLDVSLLDTAPQPGLAPLVPPYLAARWTLQGAEWAEKKLLALQAQGRAEAAVATLLAFRAEGTVWDMAERLGQPMVQAYWRQVTHIFDSSAEDWERAIAQLLAVKNVPIAVQSAEWALGKIKAATVAQVLREVIGASEEEQKRLRAATGSSYSLERLMDHLEAAPEADAQYGELLEKAERAYALNADRRTRPLLRLSAAFTRDPGAFMDLVKKAFGSKAQGLPTGPEAEGEAARSEANAAVRVLASWKGYPGQGLPAEMAEKVLLDWSLSVLRGLDSSEHKSGVQFEVARMLVRVPPDEGGHWPCIAARQLLESDEFPELADRLRQAKWNSRGMTSRSLGEGGQQERALVVRFRESARALRQTWPRTASLLDGLASDYESDATRQDEQARATLRQEGAEPADFTPPVPRQPVSSKRRAISPGLVHLNRIELSNFAIWGHLELSLQPQEGRGQWVILVGDNGRGKTTLLRALALALAGTNVAQRALGQSPAPLIQMGKSSASCEVTCGDQRYSLSLNKDQASGEVAECESTNGLRPQVFAYGCRRGSALGGGEANSLSNPVSDVATLFGESSRLVSAPSWLKDLKLRALQDPKHDDVFNRLVGKLRKPLLPGIDELGVSDNQIWADAPSLGGRVPLAALSDGYLTTLGWLVDLVARWLHWAEQVEGKPPEGDFFARMEGLVLIDEIDLHLHPRWQRNIVKCIKDAFPRLSFVVSTHNPLTLLGAESGEIVVLHDGSEGSRQPEAKQIDLPLGIRADRVLTGEWFGLSSTVDDDTLRKVKAHQKLLLDKVPENDPKRRQLEAELASRYGSYADTSLDRMALGVAADLMREREPKSAAERAEFQRKLKARVQEELALRKQSNGTKA